MCPFCVRKRTWGPDLSVACALNLSIQRTRDTVKAMLSGGEVEAVLSAGNELRGLEVKGPGPATDGQLFAKVTRAALSMGNLRDGGHVVIGIADGDIGRMLPGLNPDDLVSWMAFDHVSRRMAEYADPPLRFSVADVLLSSGATVAVFEVSEFADIPHLCARDYGESLRRGALYVRSRKMPETAEIASSVEMRDVVDLATEKALRAYIGTAERAGLGLGQATKEPSAVERYQAERERGWKPNE